MEFCVFIEVLLSFSKFATFERPMGSQILRWTWMSSCEGISQNDEIQQIHESHKETAAKFTLVKYLVESFRLPCVSNTNGAIPQKGRHYKELCCRLV